MASSLWNHRELLYQLTKRDVLNRYRGSMLGLLWSLLTPLFMLAVYTFVFGVVFRSRWQENGAPAEFSEFALILFCGLSIFGIFSEPLSRSPGIVVGNPNFVKKVVFPIEILPLSLIGSSLVNGLVSIGVLLVASLLILGNLPLTVLYLPIVLLPLLLFSAGFSWFLASLGVFVRDINQIIPIVVSSLMFLSPIFYPISVIPENLRIFYYINPLSYVVEDARRIIMWGAAPNWSWCVTGTALGLMVAYLGYLWFQKTKKGFADVI